MWVFIWILPLYSPTNVRGSSAHSFASESETSVPTDSLEMGIITPYFNFLFKKWLNFYCVLVLILLLPLLTNQTAHIQIPSER